MNSKKTFLLVDDDEDDCDFFCEAVNEIDSSSECLVVNTCEDALDKLRKELKRMPDYIFLDLNMQRMNGKQCLTEIKKDKKLKDIPVIILTTSSSKKDIEETQALGASYFLTKPADYQKLRQQINFVIGQNWT